jgi:ATP/maltotriose-dependent transcriptional regulator MalT
LLTASAGWGKTTLLATWASRHVKEVAWLALDALDNSPTRFWGTVIAALRTRVPSIGALALEMLYSPQPPPFSALLTALLNDLAEPGESAGPLVLLLDDYQVIDHPLIQETVTFWVEHQPRHVHLLLASRLDPDLPLSRWRARGFLLEL